MKKYYILKTAVIGFVFFFTFIRSFSQSLVNSSTIAYTNDVAKIKEVKKLSQEQSGNQFFQNFAGGINTLFNKNGTGISFDLSSYTTHWFIVLGEKKNNITIQRTNGSTDTGEQINYKGIDIYIINRAAINFDSLKAIANDYLTSLQASPFTLRFDKSFRLTKDTAFSETKASPIAYFKITTDARGVPYSSSGGKVSVGASANLYATLSAKFRTFQINNDGTIGNKGTVYIEPSIGFSYGTDSMMKTVFVDTHNRWLITSELRLGFTSDNNKISDWGFIFRYSFSDIVGPKFRAGIAISPDLKK
jgi:hypothetical protein